MLDLDLHLLENCDECRHLLDAYRQRLVDEQTGNPECDGWIPRLHHVEGIEVARLSVIHGKLIALGLLNFQLANLKSGVRYRVTSDAKRVLADDAAGVWEFQTLPDEA